MKLGLQGLGRQDRARTRKGVDSRQSTVDSPGFARTRRRAGCSRFSPAKDKRPLSCRWLLPALLVALALPSPAGAEEAAWKAYQSKRGATFEKRPVPGSSYDELRATIEVRHTPQQAMEIFWKVAADTSSTPKLKKTRLRESPDEVVVYQQISLSLVSDRDYTLRIWKPAPAADGTVSVRFQTANELGPAAAKGCVRLDAVRGEWSATPLPDGRTRIVLSTFSDPGGTLPAAFARGAQRDRFEVDFFSVVDQLPAR